MQSTAHAQEIAHLQDSATRFVRQEVSAHLADWEAAGTFPRSLYTRAAELGWLGMGYPEHLGGTPAPSVVRNALTHTLARESGSGGEPMWRACAPRRAWMATTMWWMAKRPTSPRACVPTG
jgi:alkylation response protein AidB-like acyl-CoA dehydrogenase